MDNLIDWFLKHNLSTDSYMVHSSAVNWRNGPFIKSRIYKLQTLELASKTFCLLILTLFPHWCKFQGHRYCPSQIIELEPRLSFKICGFSGQILIKMRLG